jgi:glutamyl-tRNA synthetase
MYRGRLAPSPTGLLHTGHARTFWTAQRRAESAGGVLVLRNEDLDAQRFRLEFTDAMLEDLRWFGFHWQEGPDCGGPYGPYAQSQRLDFYQAALEKLRAGGWVYPCRCSRQDVLRALRAPHAGEEGPIYPGTCRPKTPATPCVSTQSAGELAIPSPREAGRGLGRGVASIQDPQRQDMFRATPDAQLSKPPNWRFRVPDGETISFEDGFYGKQHFQAGKDFGDFVVWRHDDAPSYQLAVVVDDAAMKITEVVRGADLLLSTARQLLLYRALGVEPPAFYHCPLVTDESGARLAKRHDALSLRALRARGLTPQALRQSWPG